MQRVNSMADTVRSYTSGGFEGNPKWLTISDSQNLIDPQINNALNWNTEYMNSDCSLMPVVAYLADHKAETLNRVVKVTEQLAMALEFISREAKSFQRDHTLLQSFFETLEKVNPDLSEIMSRNTLELLNEKKEMLTARSEHEKLLHEIFAAHD